MTIYGMYSNIISSFIHFGIAYLLAVYLKMNMMGIAIASCIHFFVRFLVNYVCIMRSPKLKESLVPLSDPENLHNLKN